MSSPLLTHELRVWLVLVNSCNFFRCFEGAIAACAAPLVGLLAEEIFGFKGAATRTGDRATDLAKANAIGNALLCFMIIPWSLCLVAYCGKALPQLAVQVLLAQAPHRRPQWQTSLTPARFTSALRYVSNTLVILKLALASKARLEGKWCSKDCLGNKVMPRDSFLARWPGLGVEPSREFF